MELTRPRLSIYVNAASVIQIVNYFYGIISYAYETFGLVTTPVQSLILL